MARFDVKELEETHYVEIHLTDEAVRVIALNYMVGDSHVYSNLLPPIFTVLKSRLANESVYRSRVCRQRRDHAGVFPGRLPRLGTRR